MNYYLQRDIWAIFKDTENRFSRFAASSPTSGFGTKWYTELDDVFTADTLEDEQCNWATLTEISKDYQHIYGFLVDGKQLTVDEMRDLYPEHFI